MRLAALIISLLTLSLNTYAFEDMEEDLRIEMWSNETAPHSNNNTKAESYPRVYRISNTTEAELLVYECDREKNSGKAVVLCPGGAYGTLAMDNEGMLMAKWFAQNGITAAVLKYRLPNGVKEVPFEDAVEAIRIMRQRSRQLGVDPSQVGIFGASAGGHLAASVSTMAEVDQKPNFSILFYPVISSQKGLAHEGSFNNLLGAERTEELSERYSIDKRVDVNTPPAILFHCSDDTVVPSMNSVLYYSELIKHTPKAALYIFPKGGHGWGNYDNRVDFQSTWQELLLQWLNTLD